MKKIAALSALLLIPTSATAALPPGDQWVNGTLHSVNLQVRNLNPNQCVQTDSSGILTSTGSSCAGSPPAPPTVWFHLSPGLNSGYITGGASPLADIGNAYPTNGLPAFMNVISLAVVCIPFNPSEASAGHGPYTPLDSNGLGGATVDFGIVDENHTLASPINLGSVVIPTSPQGGPWITSVVNSSISVTGVNANSGFTFSIHNTSTTATQWASGCSAYVGVD